MGKHMKKRLKRLVCILLTLAMVVDTGCFSHITVNAAGSSTAKNYIQGGDCRGLEWSNGKLGEFEDDLSLVKVESTEESDTPASSEEQSDDTQTTESSPSEEQPDDTRTTESSPSEEQPDDTQTTESGSAEGEDDKKDDDTPDTEIAYKDVQFYYYYDGGDGIKEIGIVPFSDCAYPVKPKSDNASWYTWKEKDTYLFSKVENSDKWYEIKLSFPSDKALEGFATGFQISGCGSDGKVTEIAKYSEWDNKAIYDELKKAEKNCAVKGSGLYKDVVPSQIERSVTLHVYSPGAVPLIASSEKLKKLGDNGEASELAVKEEKDKDFYYEMSKYELSGAEDGWYELAFIVPMAAEGAKLIDLYFGDKWITKFINGGMADEWSTDITPVFEGKTYYKDGILSEYTADEPKPVENITCLYYYYPEALAEGDELGMYVWGDSSLISSDKVADWKKWDKDKDATYSLEPVTGYAGWYSIPIKVNSPGEKAGLQIVLKSTAGLNGAVYTLDAWNNKEIFDTITAGAGTFVIKDGNCFAGEENKDRLLRNITLFVYSDADIPNIKYKGSLTTVEGSSADSQLPVTKTDEWGNNVYEMTKSASEDGWYELTFTVPMAAEGAKLIELYFGSNWKTNFINGGIADEWSADITPAFAGRNYYKDGAFHSYEDISGGAWSKSVGKLMRLVEDIDALDRSNYKEDGLKKLDETLSEAKALLKEYEQTTDGTDEDIAAVNAAYDKLLEAYNALMPSRKEAVAVSQVRLSDDFITGADLSSYIALKESGVVFKDENGKALSDSEFFRFLKDGGTNWIRIRVWNDPYDNSGNGYGGGNNDIEKAVTLGKLATDAGMRVLIDFHYSDFWADPAKQDAPKAWKLMNVDEKADAVYSFTKSCLDRLRSAGVDVGMVQVGNETNNGVCGETKWENASKIFNAGSRAVREYDEKCMVAVHFTDPQSPGEFSGLAETLQKNNVDYDVFASSFYPYWHGTTAGLTEVLTDVAKNYNKKVMVAETSWATTWDDGDGHGNSAPKTSGQALNYSISIQGQADEMRDVVNAVNRVNETASGKGIGVFYWEPAWLSANYVYNADGTINEKLYNENKALWEKYGAGWASSYSYEYDPVDAGLWYGGSAIDNQAWFDFDGTALPTARVYSMIRTGSYADKTISGMDKNLTLKLSIGDSFRDKLPKTAKVYFNDNTSADCPITWDENQLEKITTDRAGEFSVTGKAVCEYVKSEGENPVREQFEVTLVIKVASTGNILPDAGFEDNDSWNSQGSSKWKITALEGDAGTYSIKPTGENPRSGNNGLNFYRDDVMKFTVTQTITDIVGGIYTFGGYVQGGSAGAKDVQYAKVVVTKSDGTKTTYRAECTLSGWLNWKNPEITGIKVEDGDVLEVGFEINSTKADAWGSIDDCYLYGKYSVNVTGDTTGGSVSVNSNEASSGEIVTVTANPAQGYRLVSIAVSGAAVNSAILKGENKESVYNADSKEAVITYTDVTDVTRASFNMPDSNVNVTAIFESVFGDKNEKVSLDDEKVIVKPIEPQYYTGKNLTPEVMVTYCGYVLKASGDYTLSYKDNKSITGDTNKAKAVITGKGRFIGQRTVEFDIIQDTRTDIKDAEIKFKDTACYYTGEEIEPAISLTVGGAPVPDGDYVVCYDKNINVGKNAEVIVIANSDSKTYRGSLTKKFTISKCPVSSLTISRPAGSVYTGKAIRPVITVRDGSRLLKEGRDYTVSYSNNVNASPSDNKNAGKKATCLTIAGKGNYTGKTDKIYFTITPKSINDSGISVEIPNLAANNKWQTVKAKLSNQGSPVNGKYYAITAIYDSKGNEIDHNNQVKDAGDYYAVIEGRTNYTGTIAEVPFKVVDKKYLINNAKVTVRNQYYTGTAVTLDKDSLTVDMENGKDKVRLEQGKHYTVKYLNNTKAGKATAIITGTGTDGYVGSKTVTFRILQKNLAVYQEGTEYDIIKTGAIICELVPDDDGNDKHYYTGYALTPEIKVTDATTRVTLSKGTDYVVSYNNNVKANSEAAVTISGRGNYKGKVTVKKLFTIEERKLSDFVVSIDPVSYTGGAVKPAIKFVDSTTGGQIDLKSNTAYTVKYYNNKKVAGKSDKNHPYARITEKGLSASSKEKKYIDVAFSITPAVITPEAVSAINVQNYKNKAVTPKVTVKVGGRALKAGRDYVVTYRNNTNRGNDACAVITGIGSYTGQVEKKFVIR